MHEETLNSATIDGKGTMRIGSSATTVVEAGRGCGAAVAWGVCTGLASVTRGAGAEKFGLEATAPEDCEAGLSAKVTGEDGRATEAFLGHFFFFFSCSTVEGGGRAEENSISASRGDGEATGEAGGVGFERSDEGADPNRALEEEDAHSSNIFLKRKKNDKISISKPKNFLPKTLNQSENGG